MLDLAREIRRRQDSGRRVIDLSLGQPDVPAPSHIAAALREAAKKPSTSYSATAGAADLRELIAKRYTESTHVGTDPSEVIVTPGSKHALFVTLLSLVDPGEEVLVPEPFFPPVREYAFGLSPSPGPLLGLSGCYVSLLRSSRQPTTARNACQVLRSPLRQFRSKPAGAASYVVLLRNSVVLCG